MDIGRLTNDILNVGHLTYLKINNLTNFIKCCSFELFCIE